MKKYICDLCGVELHEDRFDPQNRKMVRECFSVSVDDVGKTFVYRYDVCSPCRDKVYHFIESLVTRENLVSFHFI